MSDSECLITRLICAKNGSIDLDELTTTAAASHLPVREIIVNQEKFAVVKRGAEQTVVARTKLRVCRAKNCDGCSQLHLCKGFLFGECKFSRGRRRWCQFSHDIGSEHNQRLLRQLGLEDLDLSELRTLLLQCDTSLLPPICRDYNNGSGQYGRCQDAESCTRLHVCENYLRDSCSCPRTHDFFEPHPLNILKARGIPNDLIMSMKSVYMNKVLLRDHERGSTRGQRPNPRAAPAGGSAPGGPGVSSTASGPSRAPPNKSSEPGRDKTEICMYYIKGHCKHGDDKCYKAHCSLPYQWEVREGQQWTPLSNNEQIEEAFCDPEKTYSGGVEPVCFDTMTCGLRKVRRLSTISSVLQPTFILTTEWAWYWEDEFGNWIKYAASSDRHRGASITSEDLEEKYQDNSDGTVDFTAGSQSYTLSFTDWIQRNKQYGTARLVKRRPVFVSSADAVTIKKSKRPLASQLNFKALPGHWDKSQTCDTGFKRVSLSSTSAEYREIDALFRNTMRGFDIRQIERIQNKALWEVFQWQKDLMTKNNGGRNVTEKKLFHGTDSAHIDAICHNNFDWRICGVNGTAFGKGSYFARDAKYSHSYTGQSTTRSMFVCRVLVGSYTKGSSSYLRPPSKDGGDTHFYDSCVNSVSDPSIFVVFEKHQIYPEYLITYREENGWPGAHQYVYSNPTPAPRPAPAPRQYPSTTPTPAPRPASSSSYSHSSQSQDRGCVIS